MPADPRPTGGVVRVQKPERLWAIATKYGNVLEDTIRRSRKGAIEAYVAPVEGTNYAEDRRRYGIAAVRVLVTIEAPATQGAGREKSAVFHV